MNSPPINIPYQIILASGSPRRKELLEMLGMDFVIKVPEVDEVFPEHLQREAVARYLAELKANAFNNLKDNELIITADTIVCLESHILNKPADAQEAFDMLRLLSAKKHEVITAVCIKTKQFAKTIHVSTAVYFKELSDQEINHYILEYKPFDKAGGYGIQEWIGLIGIEKIDGSYFNVVGLPVKELYDVLSSLR